MKKHDAGKNRFVQIYKLTLEEAVKKIPPTTGCFTLSVDAEKLKCWLSAKRSAHHCPRSLVPAHQPSTSICDVLLAKPPSSASEGVKVSSHVVICPKA